jgi:biotin carboxyl carrier protein
MTRYRLTLEGKTYDATVEDHSRGLVPTAAHPLETAAMSFGPEPHVLHAVKPAPGEPDADPGAVLCPLAGKVVAIDVTLGAAVEAGAQVATIEAMKMNTYVFAPAAGRVTAIDAQPGDLVEEGAILLRLG